MRRDQRGQAVVELAFQIPLVMMLLFGAFQLARVFYVYHSLEKALRGGAGLIARSTNVNYCDISDTTLADVRNFIVYGNIQGEGAPVVPGLTADMIQILPERQVIDTTGVASCLCTTDDSDSCEIASVGHSPDFIVVNLVNGFPLDVSFPFTSFGVVNLHVSVRMPVTGG